MNHRNDIDNIAQWKWKIRRKKQTKSAIEMMKLINHCYESDFHFVGVLSRCVGWGQFVGNVTLPMEKVQGYEIDTGQLGSPFFLKLGTRADCCTSSPLAAPLEHSAFRIDVVFVQFNIVLLSAWWLLNAKLRCSAYYSMQMGRVWHFHKLKFFCLCTHIVNKMHKLYLFVELYIITDTIN